MRKRLLRGPGVSPGNHGGQGDPALTPPIGNSPMRPPFSVPRGFGHPANRSTAISRLSIPACGAECDRAGSQR
jgi:hypothetical protein